jgi:hypothetical protein
MNADLLCGSLAEPSRLRTYSAVVLGARTPDQIAAATGLSPAVVGKSAQRLLKTGLLTASADGLHAVEDVFKNAARSSHREPEPLDPDPARAAVLRAFIRDGRLTHFPTHPAKTRTVLEHLVTSFDPDRDYPESEVNTILNAWHPDHAALRRLLVDNQLLTRTNAIYRRTPDRSTT